MQHMAAPVPGPGEVLLRVCAAGVCGTDLHLADWTSSYHFVAPALPVTLGHEFSARVRGRGPGVDGLPDDTLVAVRPSVVCGACAACRSGQPDACTKRRGIGVTRDGGFAPWVVVPARNCVPVPEGIAADVAAMTEPLTVSHEAVRSGGVQRGDRVLVLGPGNIGLGIAMFARAAGAAAVIVAGRDDAARLGVAQRMGFRDVIDFAGADMAEALAPRLAAEGKFDVVFEATGASAVIEPALRALGPGGTLVIVGIHPRPVPIDLTALVRNHHAIRGSYRAPEDAWPEVLAFVQREQDVVRHLITHRVALAQAQEAFALAHARRATKVIIQPSQHESEPRP
jgi:2-desacetyl-2-hydroxyethyl bacteriochlorophyllide A dehydrogenase